jgi:hypothetical protein
LVNIDLEIAAGVEQRGVHVRWSAGELSRALLSVSSAAERNRTRGYMRRHPLPGENAYEIINSPVQLADAPPKWTIERHVNHLREQGELWPPQPAVDDGGAFQVEPYRMVVPISDVTANLLRPCYHARAFGKPRVFGFADEPFAEQRYFSLACQQGADGSDHLSLGRFTYDIEHDVPEPHEPSLLWVAGLVPLVEDGRALAAQEIAVHDYDLRQFVGRKPTPAILAAYADWPKHWPERVRQLIGEQKASQQPIASFYHSAIGCTTDGAWHLIQREATLPDLARDLAQLGLVSAGLLDSGGSVALYDAWLDTFLSHSWYYRQPRGAVLLLEMNLPQRIPAERRESWRHQRRKQL